MQTTSNLIACLARQVIGHPVRLPQQLLNLYGDLALHKRRPGLEELKTLLVSLYNEHERVFVLVDALDECEAIQERRHFLPLLESLPRGSTRLFVTSRLNNEDIHGVFEDALQVRISAPDSDVERYIKETMTVRKDFISRLTPELTYQIVTTVSAKASGMHGPFLCHPLLFLFLLARLTIH